MKTMIAVEIDYNCALVMSPEQASVFIKLIQGATVCKSEGYGDERTFIKTKNAVRLVNVPESSIKDPEAEMEYES